MKRISVLLLALSLALVGSAAMAGKKVSPETVSGAITVDAAQAKALFDDGILFVDTRKDKDWVAGRIPDAEHLDVKKAFSKESLADVAAKDEPVVFYCNGTSCMRSSKAAKLAVDWGYEKVYYYRLGFPSWKQAGYPVE